MTAPLFSDYREAVISTNNLHTWRDFFIRIAGWELRYDGVVDPSVLGLWQLPAGATADECLFGAPNTKSCFVRVVQINGVPQEVIRPNDQIWDTGGIFDLDFRVKDIDAIADHMLAAGWCAQSDPVTFAFGPFTVKEWIPRGPDGVRLAFIQRVDPPLEEWPEGHICGPAFSSSQIVRDMKAARRFYEDVLGMGVYIEHVGPSTEDGPNVFALPYNVAKDVTQDIVIVSPTKQNMGSVELLQLHGAEGRDFSARAHAPNRGLLSLKFPVTDWQAFLAHIDRQKITPIAGPQTIHFAPYGDVPSLILRAPEGAWLEFYHSPNTSSLNEREGQYAFTENTFRSRWRGVSQPCGQCGHSRRLGSDDTARRVRCISQNPMFSRRQQTHLLLLEWHGLFAADGRSR